MLIASRSLSQGRGAGFATLGGIMAGTYCYALAVAFGLSQLVAYQLVRVAVAVYLLYLAWKILSCRGSAAAMALSRRRPLGAIFRQGLLTNLLTENGAVCFSVISAICAAEARIGGATDFADGDDAQRHRSSG